MAHAENSVLEGNQSSEKVFVFLLCEFFAAAVAAAVFIMVTIVVAVVVINVVAIFIIVVIVIGVMRYDPRMRDRSIMA